jgi:hypothetical protein
MGVREGRFRLVAGKALSGRYAFVILPPPIRIGKGPWLAGYRVDRRHTATLWFVFVAQHFFVDGSKLGSVMQRRGMDRESRSLQRGTIRRRAVLVQ